MTKKKKSGNWQVPLVDHQMIIDSRTIKTFTPTKYLKVLADYPGSGKSIGIAKCINSNPNLRVIIFSATHDTLSEFEKNFPETEVEHWHGFSRLCKVPTFRDAVKDSKIPASFFCKLGQDCRQHSCGADAHCPYKAQFKTNKRIIISPLEYANTYYVKDFNPNVVVVEEAAFKKRDVHEPISGVIKSQLDIFEDTNYSKNKVPYVYTNHVCSLAEYYIDLAPNINQELQKHFAASILSEAVENGLEPSYAFIDENLKMAEAGNKALRAAMKCYRQSPLDIKRFYEYKTVMGYEQPFATPLMFALFDLCIESNTTAIIVDSNFDDFLWWMLSARYSYEKLKLNHEAKMVDFKPFCFNEMPAMCEESKIFRVNHSAWYPYATLQNYDSLLLCLNAIKRLAKAHQLTRIPVITFKDSIDTIKTEIPHADIIHFGNLRSINNFSNEDVGFCIGTYSIRKDTVEVEYQKTYQIPTRPIGSQNPEPLIYQNKEKRYVFSDELLDSFRKLYEDNEMYQALHRFRPLVKPTVIYLFGLPPQNFLNEPIQCRDLDWDELDSHIKSIEIQRGLKTSKVKESDIKASIFSLFGKFRTDRLPFNEIVKHLKKMGLGDVKTKNHLHELIKESNVLSIENSIVPKKSGRPKMYVKCNKEAIELK